MNDDLVVNLAKYFTVGIILWLVQRAWAKARDKKMNKAKQDEKKSD